MKERIKVHSIFDVNKFRYMPDESPLTKSEREMIVLPRNAKHEKVYEKFDTDFMIYLMKVPNSPAKKIVERVFNNKLIFIGTDTKQDGVLGGFLVSPDQKLAGIMLDAADLDITLSTGETNNIDLCFYTTYFNFIRSIVLLNRKSIKTNTNLNNLIISYLKNLIKKVISIPTINPKQEIFFEALIRQFYYQFMLFYDFDFAMEFTMKEVLPEMRDEVQELFRTNEMNKYKQFRDIFKALFDLKIISENPNKMMMAALSKLGMSQFLYTTQIIDYLIASIVLSNYPAFSFTDKMFVNRKVQEEIETIMVAYGNSVGYNFGFIKGV